MAGFLGKAPLTSDVGLLLEIVVIAILFFGRFGLARKKRIKEHAVLMLTAVVLHAASVLLIMIPSFEVYLIMIGFSGFFSPAMIITWIHAPAGSIALLLGGYLVVNWRFRSPAVACYKRNRLMRPLWWLWIFSLSLGLLIYASIAFF